MKNEQPTGYGIKEIVLTVDGKQEAFTVEVDRHAGMDRTQLYDDAAPFMWFFGSGWTDEQLASIVSVHRRAKQDGRDAGRESFRVDMLRMLGAADARS